MRVSALHISSKQSNYRVQKEVTFLNHLNLGYSHACLYTMSVYHTFGCCLTEIHYFHPATYLRNFSSFGNNHNTLYPFVGGFAEQKLTTNTKQQEEQKRRATAQAPRLPPLLYYHISLKIAINQTSSDI